jgi:hypothetical protein
MPGQILFFRKSRGDLSNETVSATASEGALYAEYALTRGNLNAWITSGSVDANDTTWEVDFGEAKDISEILLLKHNFKEFKVEYWDGSSYQDFSPAIIETVNTLESNYYETDLVSTSKVRVTIYGTQTPNEDKYMYQFIATEKLGRLNGWPIIKAPKHSRNRIKTQTLSGKMSIVENIGGFSCKLGVSSLSDWDDLDLIETLYDANEGFLVWLCGGDENQFRTVRQGYRMEDIYLMKCSDEYQPEYVGGLYKSGIKIEIDLQEVIE